MHEAWADHANKRPPGTPRDTRGRGLSCARPNGGTPEDARGRGRPREPATARHTPGREAEADRANQRPPGTPRGARPGPVVRTPQRWHTGRCARPRPAARGTPGRTCPTGPVFVGSMCEHDTRVCRPASRVGAPASRWGPGLALGPRPRGVIAVRRASTPMPASARPRRLGTGRPPASRALRACRSGRRGRSR